MRRMAVALIVTVPSLATARAQSCGVGDNRLTAAEEQDGFVLLFDGQSLEGWEGDQALWQIEDGMIVGRHNGSIERNQFLSYMHAAPAFSDFVLRVSCYVPSGNSGIQYRSMLREDLHVIGYQADIMKGRYWGCLYDEGGGRGILADGWAGKAETVVVEDGWNEYEIVCQGDHLIQRLNGLTCVDIQDEALDAGLIAFQIHRGPAMEARFKNIRLKRLAPGDPLPEETPGVPAGWTGLFAGENIDNWDVVGSEEGFRITDQRTLRSEGGKGGDWLRSKKQYSDFIFHVEYVVSPGGNSGAFIRSAAEGAPWTTGHECQISNEQPPRDDLHCTGTLYGNVAANPRPDESPGVWHTYDIHCVGPLITVIVDGQRTLNVDATTIDATKDKPLSGYVGVQDSHTGPEGWVEFRNIRIKELKPGE